MKKYALPLSCIASFLMFLGAYAFTNDLFWLILSVLVFVVIVVLWLLPSANNASKTEKTVSEPLRTSQGEVRHPAVPPADREGSAVKSVKEAVSEEPAPEPIPPKPEDTQTAGAVSAAPFPLLKSEFQDGKGLKRSLEEIREWCLSSSESQVNPNDRKSINLLFEQLNDCVDCQIVLDSVRSGYTYPFIKTLKSAGPVDNTGILRSLLQLAMLMIDLSQMSHSYENYDTSKEDRLWFKVLKGELPMDVAMKKARKVDENPAVTPAQYRNMKTFLREYADISEEGFRIYNGYIL